MKGCSSSKGVLERYHAAVHDAFAAYGSFVAAHPLQPLLIGILLLGSLCIGLLRAKQESNIENLWVDQNSRIVSEKQAYNTYFGGISRKQSVAMTMKDFPDKNLNDLGQTMDALTLSVKPLYDGLTWNFSKPDQSQVELIQNDFCERPLVPKTLRSGADPNIHGNWYTWGYRSISKCSLDTIGLFLSKNFSQYYLPDDWGFDVFPCYKLSPMDCFQEGKAFDYPQALQQLEQLVIINATLNATLNQVVLEVERLSGNLCFNQLQNKLNNNPKSIGVTTNLSSEEITSILTGIKTVITVFAAWGYNWRPSYKNMSSEEILSYFNKAIDFSKNTSITKPAIEYCITEHRPCCLTWFGATSPVEASFGSVKYDQSGELSSIGSLRWGANNWNQNHPLWVEYIATRLNTSFNDEQRKNLVLSWENLMVEYLSQLHGNADGTNFSSGANFEDYQVQFTIWRSIEDVLKDANNVPIWQIILSAVLVFFYSLACFINLRHPVHSHGWLVLMGIIVVSFAIIAGFGLTSAFGIKLSPLAGSVVPFLALGLGIDDVFVLVNMLRIYMAKNISVVGVPSSVIPQEEMKLIVSHAGPSVVLTTLSVLASFFISSVTPIPVIRWFCWQMGTTAVLHTFGMLLIFIPIMSLDARRIKAGIIDPLFWIFCCMRRGEAVLNNEPPDTYNGYKAKSPISIAVVKHYTPLFKYKSFKIIMTLLFAILLGMCTYFGFWKVQIGLNLSDITLKGSYQHDYARLTEISYPQYDIYLVTDKIEDYSAVQTQLLEAYNRPENNLSITLGSSAKILGYTWLENLIASVNLSLNIPYPYSPQNFTKLAQSWSTSPLGILSLQDLYCENSSTGQQTSCFAEQDSADWSIRATKTVVFANNLGSSTKNNIEMIKQTRKSLDDLNSVYFNGSKVLYMYGYPFLFNEQYLHSSHDLYMVVGFALVGVFFAVLIFQFSFTISFIIALLLLVVDIEVYGFVYVFGAELNALSLVNLGIVIGMASEFTYLARSFLLFEGTRTERVQKALEWTFEPLLHGLGTQVVATLPLLLLKFHAFRVYYFGMFTIMGVLGFLNGFVMLPIILSWIGPPTLTHMKKRTTLPKTDRNEEQQAQQYSL